MVVVLVFKNLPFLAISLTLLIKLIEWFIFDELIDNVHCLFIYLCRTLSFMFFLWLPYLFNLFTEGSLKAYYKEFKKVQ